MTPIAAIVDRAMRCAVCGEKPSDCDCVRIECPTCGDAIVVRRDSAYPDDAAIVMVACPRHRTLNWVDEIHYYPHA